MNVLTAFREIPTHPTLTSICWPYNSYCGLAVTPDDRYLYIPGDRRLYRVTLEPQ